MNENFFATAFPATTRAYEEGLAAGLHFGAQIYIARNGQPLADVGLGESRPGVAMTSDTLMLWLSAGKPVTAAAVMQPWERGRLNLDDRVATFIPEFGQRGKEGVTIRQLLTHTGGFRFTAIDVDRADWDSMIERICAMRLEEGWKPGQRAGYHPTTSWFILGELVRRIDGRPLAQYVREEIFLPLGMRDSWIGMPPEIYRGLGERIGLLANTERPEAGPHRLSTCQGAALGDPGGGALGPMHDLGRFYETLLRGGQFNGARILDARTVEQMISRQRIGMVDETFRATIDWGLGLMLDSKRYGTEPPYGYGPYASDATFGHSGSQSSAAFADPRHDLVVALVFNGTPGEARHQSRIRGALAAIYRDLGLAAD